MPVLCIRYMVFYRVPIITTVKADDLHEFLKTRLRASPTLEEDDLYRRHRLHENGVRLDFPVILLLQVIFNVSDKQMGVNACGARAQHECYMHTFAHMV